MEWRLSDQLCFLLYANSRQVIRMYKHLLDPLNLTYTQYITMIALWEENHQSVSELGEKLFLDSGTLTPLLKKLEKENRIKRTRDTHDERKVWIDLTEEGKKLAEAAKNVPMQLYQCVDIDAEDAQKLYEILSKVKLKEVSCDMKDDAHEA